MFTTRFIHLTDPHLITEAGDLYGTNPYERFKSAANNIATSHGDIADFAVITGDLAHWGEHGAYEKLKSLLEIFPFSVELVIGNHDSRGVFREVFPGSHCDENGFIQGFREQGGNRFVFMDTVVEGTHAGGYCEKRCAWLDSTLSASELPVMLFMHHPPFLIGLPSMDAIALRDRERLREVVEPYKHKVRQLFYGHVHRPIGGNWMGISCSTIYGTNHQVALDFTSPEEKIPGSTEEPAYSIVFASDDHVVIHQHQFLSEAKTYSMTPAYGQESREYALGDFR